MNKKLLGYVALFAAIALLPAVGAYPIFVMKVMCYALFACAFNLLIGFTGLLSFGHAAFLGMAAYTAGHALKVWGLPAPLGLLAGTGAAALTGLVFGLLAIRRSGIYFSMITLALAQMLYFFFLQASFTGGEDGLQAVPRGSFLGLDLANDLTLYYVVLAIFIAAFWLIYRIVHSPFGQVLTSIRENEARATSLGYDTAQFKLLAFVLSAALAGLAGATKTLVLGFATLTDAIWTTSGLVILMTLVGGMGTLVGPMVGALVIIALENKIGDLGGFLAQLTGIAWFNGLGESVSLVTGLIFIVCVLAFRRGLVGETVALWERWTAAKRAA
ncbi:MAG: branched-chain amino acid ABC transporter permease [Roseateles sp.]|uniref:branched-chain amino acid ABC transporter permease n=1 Tax=Roseateles sp. TaxID=1971397 RepID=UPI0039E9BDDA